VIWTAVALLGAVAWGILALSRGEEINAVWLLFAALCSYAIAYRFYARFIVKRVLEVDDKRAPPAIIVGVIIMSCTAPAKRQEPRADGAWLP